MISDELLNILRCPLSKATLVFHEGFLVSTDPETRRRYRIEDSFPVMLIDESEELTPAEWQKIMNSVRKKS